MRVFHTIVVVIVVMVHMLMFMSMFMTMQVAIPSLAVVHLMMCMRVGVSLVMVIFMVVIMRVTMTVALSCSSESSLCQTTPNDPYMMMVMATHGKHTKQIHSESHGAHKKKLIRIHLWRIHSE